MADLVAAAGLELPPLTKATQRQLHEWIPPYLRVSNPVDNGGPPVRDWRGPKIIDAIIADPNVDLILCPITGALPSMADKLTRDLVAAAAKTDKPMLVVWGSPTGDEAAYRETLLGSAVPTFRTFTNAVMAAKAYFDHHRFAAGYRSPFARPGPAALGGGRARSPTGGPRGRSGSERLHPLRAGLQGACWRPTASPCPTERVAQSAAEAVKAATRIGYPVVMKVASADIPHKSDLGLVEVGVRSDAEVRQVYRQLVDRAPAAAPGAALDGVLVAQQASGVETVLGIARDELFGPVVMFGLGGVFVEVLKDVTFRVPPFSAAEAALMLDELAGAALLARGAGAAGGRSPGPGRRHHERAAPGRGPLRRGGRARREPAAGRSRRRGGGRRPGRAGLGDRTVADRTEDHERAQRGGRGRRPQRSRTAWPGSSSTGPTPATP